MSLRKILFLCVLLYTPFLNAMNLEIVLEEPISNTVPKYGQVSAFYNVQNTTTDPLKAIFVKKLPKGVTQVTCDPKYCGAHFDLGPNGSENDHCILKLTIKSPVHANQSDLLICTRTQCNGTNTPLNVSLGKSLPFIGIASGSFSNHQSGIFPLLASSHDSGSTWFYPTDIFQQLQHAIDPAFENGILSSASCNISFNKNVCVAAGQSCAGEFCEHSLPLVAVGTQQATQWAYPQSVFKSLETVVDPDFTSGSLRSSSCFGSGNNTICIAGGTYSTNTAFFPLLARSGDGGKNWTYPSSIFQNLTQTVDPDFKKGSLFTASCTTTTCNGLCITAGNFCTDNSCNMQLPLLAVSHDNANTWHYPPSIIEDFKTQLEPDTQTGYFVRSSCTGAGAEAVCTAVGTFNTKTTLLPLLALTRNGGRTWYYPKDVFSNLPNTIGHGFDAGLLNAVSCSGSGSKALCMASGGYFRKGSEIPFLTLSRDGGRSWSYPDFVYTKLKTIVDPEFVGGNFDGAACIDSGKKGICLAAGGYCRADQSCYPLIAATQNGGKTWSYPSSVYKDLAARIDPHFKTGFFSDISCQGSADHNFCLASGQYSNDSSDTFPLLAFSIDNGQTWRYPASIYQNLTTQIDADFAIGSFNRAAASGGKLSEMLTLNTVMPQPLLFFNNDYLFSYLSDSLHSVEANARYASLKKTN